jgi:hypothetical protein
VNDDEILAKWRKRYPYIDLGEAKALQRTDYQFGHLGVAQMLAEEQDKQEAEARLRELVNRQKLDEPSEQ